MFGEVPVDAYKLQTHTFENRFGVTGVSEALGYSKEWFGRLPKRGARQFKSLQKDGFTGCQIEVSVPRKRSLQYLFIHFFSPSIQIRLNQMS